MNWKSLSPSQVRNNFKQDNQGTGPFHRSPEVGYDMEPGNQRIPLSVRAKDLVSGHIEKCELLVGNEGSNYSLLTSRVAPEPEEISTKGAL